MSINMANAANQWVLFGFDLRQLWSRFAFAWKDVFFNFGSSLRLQIDVPVKLYDANNLPPKEMEGEAEAFVLPDELVLERKIPIATGININLDSLVAAEIGASSPFRQEDTVFGWRLIEPSSDNPQLIIALASKAAILAYLHQSLNVERSDIEIWADVDGYPIVVEGFAEKRRNQNYKKRLSRLAVYCLSIVVAFIAICAVPVVYKHYELSILQVQLAEVSAQARKMVALRGAVADKNAAIERLMDLAQTSARPLGPLSNLTNEIPDDAWLTSFEQQGNRVVIEGNSVNAALLLEQLAEKADYLGVRPLSAIRKVGRQGVERFRLELLLPAGGESVGD